MFCFKKGMDVMACFFAFLNLKFPSAESLNPAYLAYVLVGNNHAVLSVRNRLVVFHGGQRPQYIVTCTGDNMQENPLTGGEIHIYKYTSNTPSSNSWWIHNTEFG
jgi:hypothetical protein